MTDGGVHYHTAIHGTVTVQEDNWATFAYDVVRAVSSQSSTLNYGHGHSIPATGSSTCYTQTVSTLPPYVSVDFLMTTQDTFALPVGVVALWDGGSFFDSIWLGCQ